MMHKEMANQIFKGMYQPIFDIDNGVNAMQDKLRYDAAKQCSLKAVNEIIEAIRRLFDSPVYPQKKEYWRQVKTEIEKL
jgi:hypothetical protein